MSVLTATGTPSAAGPPRVDVAQVEPLGRRVDLDRLAVRAGGGEDRLEVDVVGLARVEAAAGGMREHVHAGVAERAHDARGHLRARLLEARVHGGQHHVQLGQHLVGEVERAVGQDVALAAGQDADAEARLQRADGRAICARSSSTSRPPAIVVEREWSDTMMYS